MGIYSRRGREKNRSGSSEAKADDLIEQIKEMNGHFAWLREYIEESELAECLNEIADNTTAMRQVFEKVSKIQGGVGVVSSLINGIVSNAAKTREQK